MKVLYVEWIDATATAGWDKFDRKDATVDLCKSIGFLVKQNKDMISLAAAISDKECNAIINIPTLWIKKKKYVKV